MSYISRKEDRSNVFHGSKVVSLLTSTPDRSHLGKAMTLFSCDEYHVRCCGWLRGLAERAICEYSPAIGSLKNGYGSIVSTEEDRKGQTFQLIYVVGCFLSVWATQELRVISGID